MISWFLLSLMGGPENYATFSAFCGSSLGKFMLVGWAIAASFHVCSGIRHLFFDTGRLFEIEHATLAGYTVLLGTFIFSCVLLITACAGGN